MNSRLTLTMIMLLALLGGVLSQPEAQENAIPPVIWGQIPQGASQVADAPIDIQYRDPGRIRLVKWVDDQTFVVVAGKGVHVYDREDLVPQTIARPEKGEFTAASLNGRYLALAESLGPELVRSIVSVYDLETGQPVWKTLVEGMSVWRVSVAPDARKVAVVGLRYVGPFPQEAIFALVGPEGVEWSNKTQLRFYGPDAIIEARVGWSPEGERVLFSFYERNANPWLRVYDPTGKLLKEVDRAYTWAWSPQGDKIAVAGVLTGYRPSPTLKAEWLVLFDSQMEKVYWNMTPAKVAVSRNLWFDPTGRYLATDLGGLVSVEEARVLNRASSELPRSGDVRWKLDGWSPRGGYLLAYGGYAVRIYSPLGELVHIPLSKLHEKTSQASVEWGPSGDIVVAQRRINTLYLITPPPYSALVLMPGNATGLLTGELEACSQGACTTIPSDSLPTTLHAIPAPQPLQIAPTQLNPQPQTPWGPGHLVGDPLGHLRTNPPEIEITAPPLGMQFIDLGSLLFDRLAVALLHEPPGLAMVSVTIEWQGGKLSLTRGEDYNDMLILVAEPGDYEVTALYEGAPGLGSFNATFTLTLAGGQVLNRTLEPQLAQMVLEGDYQITIIGAPGNWTLTPQDTPVVWLPPGEYTLQVKFTPNAIQENLIAIPPDTPLNLTLNLNAGDKLEITPQLVLSQSTIPLTIQNKSPQHIYTIAIDSNQLSPGPKNLLVLVLRPNQTQTIHLLPQTNYTIITQEHTQQGPIISKQYNITTPPLGEQASLPPLTLEHTGNLPTTPNTRNTPTQKQPAPTNTPTTPTSPPTTQSKTQTTPTTQKTTSTQTLLPITLIAIIAIIAVAILIKKRRK